MKEVWPGLLLAFPLALYVGAVGVGSATGSQGTWIGMFAAMVVLSILAALPNERLHTGSSVTLLGVSGAVVAVLFAAPSVGVELLAASLLATPALVLTYCVRPGALGWRLFGFAIALTDGLGLLVAAHAVNAVGTSVSGSVFVREFVSLNVTQLEGLAGLLNSTGGLLPLRDFFDPVFVVLAAVAAVGLFVPSLRPQTAWEEKLPHAFSVPPLIAPDRSPLGLGADLETALKERSVPQSPARGVPPGLLPLLGGCGAGVVLVAIALVSPAVTLALLSLSTLLALGLAIAIMRRPLPAGAGA